jgi:hypothetical protein
LPGSILLTIPRNCAPGGELSVTNMVSPINWFDMSHSVSRVPPSQKVRWSVIQLSGRVVEDSLKLSKMMSKDLLAQG